MPLEDESAEQQARVAYEQALTQAQQDGADATTEQMAAVARLRAEYEALGGVVDSTTSSLEALAAAGTSSAADIMRSLSMTAEEARQGMDAYYDNLSALFQDKKSIYMDLLTGLGANYQTSVDEFSTSSERFTYQVGGTIDEMYSRFMTTDLPMYFGKFEEFAGFASQVYGAVGSGYAAMRSMGDDAARQIESSALMAKGLGFTATQMMDAMDAQFSKTGEFSNEILREITTYSNSIAEVTGDSNKVIARGILDITTDFETFGKVSVQSAAETIGGLRAIGLEVKDLSAVAKKFMNFDTAAESLANLNTVFGMQIDTMGMMEAASRDPFDAMMMLREGFLATGQDFENLTIQQQNLLASQAGIDTEAAARLFDPDRVVANMDELSAATEETAERGVLNTTEALNSLADSMSRIPGLQGKFSETVMNRMAMRDLSALSNSALVAEARLTNFAATAQTRVPAAIGAMLGDEEGQLGADVLQMVDGIKGSMLTGINSLNDGIATEIGQMGRDVPQTLFESLSDEENEQVYHQSGEYISAQIQGGMIPITPEVGNVSGGGSDVEAAGDLYVPSVGGPAFSLDDPADEVIIGRPGGAVTRAIARLGQDAANAARETAGSEGVGSLREVVGVGERQINLSLVVKLGGQSILDLKELLINSAGAGGVDFVREVVA